MGFDPRQRRADVATEFVDELPWAPSERRESPVLAEFADKLRANAGRWAEYPYPSVSGQGARSLASRINHRRGPLALRGDFQAATSNGVVYVRYRKAHQL